MSFGSRLKQRREILGLKQSELGKMLGITGAAIGNYENGISSPKADILYQVFDVLQCDANYLFQDEMKELGTDDLTVPEIKMVKKYRDLDNHGKEMVDVVLEMETARMDMERKAKQARAMADSEPLIYGTKWFCQPMSAGDGMEAGDDAPESLYLIKEPPRGTSYVAPVRGNSMEPTYHDGDKLFISAQDSIRPGQIGVFLMDGKQWVKELGYDVLISHNSAYPPRRFTEDVRCPGACARHVR